VQVDVQNEGASVTMHSDSIGGGRRAAARWQTATTRRWIAALALLAVVLGCGDASHHVDPVGVTERTFETRSVSSGATRELATTIWYPAVRQTETGDTEVVRDAVARQGMFPLVLYLHGTCGSPTEATYLTTALARAGVIVAAPATPGYTDDDYPACSTPAAGVEAFVNAVPDIVVTIDAMLAEASDAASPFAQRIDPDRIAVSGVSFGAFAALLAAQREPRVSAVLALVPANAAFLGETPISVPAMIVGAEHDQIAGFAQAELAYGRLAGPRILLELLDANHLSAIDSCVSPAFGNSCVSSDIPQDEAHRLILTYALPFIERFVLRDGSTSLPGPLADVVLSESDL
jgi:predicted dienelactone hydrolase